MTVRQQIITIACAVGATLLTRFLPFLVFRSKQATPKYIDYLGKALPGATFALLVVYCLKNVSLLTGNHGLPEFIAIIITGALHAWRRNMFLSIAAGTLAYMVLVQRVF